ncbi:hypothetical protein ASD44_12825 [Mesorhizobium sp. Root554]|uniref:anthrone oxygenase family protein n=1 Tax=unclassified Mesorhizobium TaxID=325217 RepID=UPI0006F89C86|nr:MULTISPECIES: anthrone oxygenase family protein [unclassified Mesorhizobium]KQZ14847.1 hypothetical protein ASD27_12830 [Mesorhizobium sp. Root1471]KQZ37356.1 hypothetical protein ASD44_12825 [Mesorhizobium sp. Root554]
MTGLIFSALTLAAILGSGLMAGLFFAFSTAVMAALARLPAGQGATAMNAINMVIQNPVFLAVFMGTALVCAALAVKAVLGWSQPGSLWLLAGGLFYLVGIFGITVVFNVPLNDVLAAVDPASSEGTALWTRYLDEWVFWNHARTVGGIVSLASFWLAGR